MANCPWNMIWTVWMKLFVFFYCCLLKLIKTDKQCRPNHGCTEWLNYKTNACSDPSIRKDWVDCQLFVSDSGLWSNSDWTMAIACAWCFHIPSDKALSTIPVNAHLQCHILHLNLITSCIQYHLLRLTPNNDLHNVLSSCYRLPVEYRNLQLTYHIVIIRVAII